MEINNIILELLSRIQVLENKVSALELQVGQFQNQTQTTVTNRPVFPTEKISRKYKALAEYLYEKWEKKIQVSYEKIEEILGFSLPETAYNFPQSYWANTQTHSYASSWLAIGYKAKVDVENKVVIFEKDLY